MRALALTLILGAVAIAAAPPAPSNDLSASLEVLRAASDAGLPAADLEGLERADDPDPAAAAVAEGRLRRAALDYVTAQYGGRIAAQTVNRYWSPAPPPEGLAAAYEAARHGGALSAWLAGAAPADPRYRALVEARRRYQAFAEAGGWPGLPAARPDGRRDARTLPLRERLVAEGYDAAAAPGQDPGLADARLTAALELFRRRHGLAAGGGLDGEALAALNVPAAERLAQIDANLERWRWLPRVLPARRIEVDVAAAELTLVEPGQPDLRLRAIVGQPSWPTPLFAAEVTSIVFNPPWVVPGTIAKAELWPTERLMPGYLKRNHYSLIDGQLVQAPGPDSALGELKFDFASPYGVYLHDTPSRQLFARDRRMLSHGCMRVQQPRQLAARLLAPDGWTVQRIAAAIAARKTSRTPIQPTPLFVVYRTAEVGEDGAVWFRPDSYGWDARLGTALAAVDRGQGAGAPGRRQ